MPLAITPLEGRVILTDYDQPLFTKAPSESVAVFRGLSAFWRNPYGDPRFRVVWGEQAIKTRGGQSILAYRKKNPSRVQVGWLQGDQQYPMTVDIATLPKMPILQPIVETRWTGNPFWVLEEWESPEVLVREWEPRFMYVQRLGKVVDWMGAVPPRGCYRAVAFIHDGDYGYHALPDALPMLVKGLVAESQSQAIDNPYLENTPGLIAMRKVALDAELDAAEAANREVLAERFVDAAKTPRTMEDLQTAVHSEIDWHLKRMEELKRAAK